MRHPASTVTLDDVGTLLRAEPAGLRSWVAQWQPRRLVLCVAVIVLGAGLYGAAMGSWRGGLQILYTGIKLPLVILLTTLGNALLNGLLAPLLGLNLTFRQCLSVILLTFAIASAMLAAFSPLAAFLVWNTPPLMVTTGISSPAYGFLQLCLVVFLAVAGVVGNLCLVPLLRVWSGCAAVARRVLLSWLAVNLLLGSQVSWSLRPFIWDPARPVEFLGPEYLRGSFFETVFEALRRLLLG